MCANPALPCMRIDMIRPATLTSDARRCQLLVGLRGIRVEDLRDRVRALEAVGIGLLSQGLDLP